MYAYHASDCSQCSLKCLDMSDNAEAKYRMLHLAVLHEVFLRALCSSLNLFGFQIVYMYMYFEKGGSRADGGRLTRLHQKYGMIVNIDCAWIRGHSIYTCTGEDAPYGQRLLL